MTTDEELIYLIREKNEDAEMMLVTKYHTLMQKISFRAVGYFAQDSEVQSTAYFVLMQCIASYDEFMHYLFFSYYQMCLRKRLYSLLRQKRYSEKSRFNYNYIDIHETEVSDYTMNDPIQRYIVEENKQTIKKYLTVQEDRIFEQSVEGYAHAEIAEIEGVSIKKVYNTIHKVRKMAKTQKS